MNEKILVAVDDLRTDIETLIVDKNIAVRISEDRFQQMRDLATQVKALRGSLEVKEKEIVERGIRITALQASIQELLVEKYDLMRQLAIEREANKSTSVEDELIDRIGGRNG